MSRRLERSKRTLALAEYTGTVAGVCSAISQGGNASAELREALLALAVAGVEGCAAASIPARPGMPEDEDEWAKVLSLAYWAARERVAEGVAARDETRIVAQLLADLGLVASEALLIERAVSGEANAVAGLTIQAGNAGGSLAEAISFALGQVGVRLLRFAALAMLGAAGLATDDAPG